MANQRIASLTRHARGASIGKRACLAFAIALAATIVCGKACAESQAAPAGVDEQFRSQRLRIEQQNALLVQQARELEDLKQSLAALQAQVERLAGARVQADAPPRKVAQQTSSPGGAPASTEVGKDLTKDEAPSNAAVSSISEQASVLTPSGHWSLEPSLQYQYSSKDQVSILGVSILPAITVGLIDVERVSQTEDIAALTARYGIAPRSEIELRVPYVYADQDTVGRPFGATGSSDVVTGAHGSGIGDIEIATRHQFDSGNASMPYLIGEARVRAPSGRGPFSVPVNSATGLPEAMPTGSGFWGAFAAATAIYPSDPAVFFGSINYLWNIGRNEADVGYVRPGNSIGLNFGSGLSLNEFASLSFGYEQDWLSKTTEAGVPLPSTTGLQVGRLLLGYSYRLSARTTVNVSLAIGATDAAPNTQITVRVPYSF
jgi:hypothetical protein